MFDDFWEAYPNKKAKIAARKAYDKALKEATHEEIMAGVRNYVEAEPWDGNMHHCKHPTTWLNGGCWDDEHAPRHREPEWWERKTYADIQRERKLDS